MYIFDIKNPKIFLKEIIKIFEGEINQILEKFQNEEEISLNHNSLNKILEKSIILCFKQGYFIKCLTSEFIKLSLQIYTRFGIILQNFFKNYRLEENQKKCLFLSKEISFLKDNLKEFYLSNLLNALNVN